MHATLLHHHTEILGTFHRLPSRDVAEYVSRPFRDADDINIRAVLCESSFEHNCLVKPSRLLFVGLCSDTRPLMTSSLVSSAKEYCARYFGELHRGGPTLPSCSLPHRPPRVHSLRYWGLWLIIS